MKHSFAVCFFFLSLSLFAQNARYSVHEGRLHKGGTLVVEATESSQEFLVKMTYELFKKSWVPLPNDQLKGDAEVALPPEFKDERGYLELEKAGELTLPEAIVKFLRRTDYKNFKNAFLIEVIPKNGKSVNHIIYHPDAPASGWVQIEIRLISSISALNRYKIIAELIP